jgi:hypothetical protein
MRSIRRSFWRVAQNAREIHEPFLAKCIADRELFTSLAVRSNDRLAGIAITAHKVFPRHFRKIRNPVGCVNSFPLGSARTGRRVVRPSR